MTKSLEEYWETSCLPKVLINNADSGTLSKLLNKTLSTAQESALYPDSYVF